MRKHVLCTFRAVCACWAIEITEKAGIIIEFIEIDILVQH